MTLLSAHGILRRIGERAVLDHVDLSIEEGDRIGLIGRNGAGKSTLIRCLTGEEAPDDGELITKKGLRIAVVEQVPKLDLRQTVGEAVMAGMAERKTLAEALEAVEARMMDASGDELDALVHEQAELGEALDRTGGRSLEHQADAVLDALSAPHKARVLETLSLGERRRVGLAIGLLAAPDLLILDEPTNHLDVETIEWLEGYLRSWSGASLIVTHDRFFLENVCSRMAEIDRGDLRIYEGSYAQYLEKKAEREAIEARAENNRQRTIKSELEWVRRGPPARTTKSKARLQRFDALVDDAPKAHVGQASFQIPHPARIGKTILELKKVSKSYGAKRLVDTLDLILTKGARIGIVGPNGAGKTTLLKMILGEVEPDAGKIEVGVNTKIVYADQGRTELHDENTVLEEISEGGEKVWVGDRAIQPQSFLEGLLFEPAQQRAKIGTLSGGERTRVALAKRLRVTGNLLILDEPTNDLDLATLRVLEEALLEYPGCVLVVSHDRWFLDRVTTAVLAFEGQGRVTLYEGGHADWRAHRAARAEEDKAPKVKLEPRAEPAAPAATATSKGRRRTFKEERELEGMEERILEAEGEVEALEARVSDPDIIKELGAGIAKELERLETQRAGVEALYSRWDELSQLTPH